MRQTWTPYAALCVACLVEAVHAECWTRNDGVVVCNSDDHPSWLVVWWFWLAVLLAIMMVCSCPSVCCPKRYREKFSFDADYTEPLLGRTSAEEQQQFKLNKVKYRYLDEV